METVGCKNIKKFACIEKELNLFERSYNGFFYWQHIRIQVCESLFGNRIENEKKERNKRKRRIVNTIIEVCKGFIESIKLDFHLFWGDANRKLLFFRGPTSSDKFLDTWNLPDNITVSNYRLVSCLCDSNIGDYFLEEPILLTAIEKRVRNIFKLIKKDTAERKFLDKLERRFRNDFGQTLSADDMEQYINYFKIMDKHYSRMYRRIFRYSKCKAIAFECYYSNALYPAQRIARESGIAIVELQHGVINNHEAYWFEDSRGINNYVPDFFLTFGEIHNKWIKLVNGAQPIAVGFPYQEQCIKEVQSVATNEKEIIIYPESDPHYEEILNEFIDKITPMGYHVYVKIHPLESTNVSIWYPLLVKNQYVEIVTDQSMGIYYWLKRAKHHIMASTTVGLEAVALNHPNVCIATNMPHEQVQCLLDWKIARGFSTVQQLIDLILDPIDLNNKIARTVREKLWKSNASANITMFFSELL